ncbi:MAG: sigma-70 family RNA polymerase sigma factor [Chitinophagaceae bacterium]
MKNLSNESTLALQMQAGSQEAFTLLYRHYSPQLYQNIFRMTHDTQITEEIVQELFTIIWQKRENKGISENFAGYVYRTGQHLVHDFFRKMQKDHLLVSRFKSFISEDYEHFEKVLEEKQSSEILKKAIDQLSPQQKKVYELVKVEGYTYKKAAEILGISPLTVKEYLVATKKSIQNYLLRNMDTAFTMLILAALSDSFH